MNRRELVAAWTFAFSRKSPVEEPDHGAAGARAQVKPQMLSNLLWALATLQVSQRPLLDALAAEVLRQLPGFKPQARGLQAGD